MPTSRDRPNFGGELLSAGVKRLVLDRIVRGDYPPGERIVEFQLAKELGVSQSPVREALRELAAIGIVTTEPRRGSRVRLPSGKELSDVSVLRSEVDALACRLAVDRLGDDALDELGELVDRMFQLLDADDMPGVTEADVRFHQIIAVASANEPLARTFEQLAPFARTFITLTLRDVDITGILDGHGTILRALRDGDGPAAGEAARAHQLHAGRLLFEHFPAATSRPDGPTVLAATPD